MYVICTGSNPDATTIMPILNVVQIFIDGVVYDCLKDLHEQMINKLKYFVSRVRKEVKCMKMVILLVCLWIHFGGIVGLHNLT